MAEALTPAAWIVMIVAIVVLWGVGSWALYRTMHDEDRKLELLEKQERLDTYSPTALAELREWIQNNPDDRYRTVAVDRYNECVETLKEVDNTFYDWSESEIEELEEL